MKFTFFWNDGVAESVNADSLAAAKRLTKHGLQKITPDGRKLKIVQTFTEELK